jgi:hypothetical protein
VFNDREIRQHPWHPSDSCRQSHWQSTEGKFFFELADSELALMKKAGGQSGGGAGVAQHVFKVVNRTGAA